MSEQTGLGADAARARETALAQTVRVPAGANDFTPPDVPQEWRNQLLGWYTEGFPPYIPGLSDPKG